MKIALPYGVSDNPTVILQRCGYSHHRDFNSGQDSYVRRLGGENYPRFHIYLNEENGSQILNLHLDQKKPSYAGAHAHSGEYDGELVEREASRIDGIARNELHNQQQGAPEPERKSFLSKFFGRE